MYKIKELTDKLNIKPDTIRYYEKIGLVKAPNRKANGYRLYSDDDLLIFKFILRCKEFGFTLKEIRPIISFVNQNKKTPKNLDVMLKKKIDDIQRKQKELRDLKKQLNILLESCIKEDCSLLDYL